MDLILWRHAEAEDGGPDLERELTAKGHKQSARVAEWLRQRLPGEFEVVSSPAARALQTAEALKRKIRTERTLAPGASAAAILKAAGWPQSDRTVVLVGHQPDFGRAVAHLVAGTQVSWSIKKGGFWWLTSREREGEDQVVVTAVMSPDLL